MPPATSYDAVRYPSYPFQQTHPARTAAIARLLGVAAASPAKCRVLELGCGTGDNLLPIAAAYPESEFVGLDLAATAIDIAEGVRVARGLNNVRLAVADIAAVGDEYGTFDYVIAHGVFSWVPDAVRLALLALTRRVLSPNGVAYISYNAYPGCYVRRMFWDAMRFHTQSVNDSAQKIQQSRAVMHLLAEGTSVKGPLGDYLRAEAKHLAFDHPEAVLFHDDLSPANRPFYFHEFAELAGRHGLRFLSEADFSDMDVDVFPPAVAEKLRQLGEMSVIAQQQYRDFLTARRFRQTLLVRAEVPASTTPAPAGVKELFAATETRPTPAAPDLSAGVVVRFELASGAAISIDHPFAKAVMAALGRAWPHPLAFPTLAAAAADMLGRPAASVTPHEEQVATEVLLAAFGSGMVNLFADPPRTVSLPGLTPKLAPGPRHQLETGSRVVTNLLHIPVKIEEELTRQLLLALDGTRDAAGVVERLVKWATATAPGAMTEPELRAKFTAEIAAGFGKAAELALLEE